jgi:hypothetical protein
VREVSRTRSVTRRVWSFTPLTSWRSQFLHEQQLRARIDEFGRNSARFAASDAPRATLWRNAIWMKKNHFTQAMSQHVAVGAVAAAMID